MAIKCYKYAQGDTDEPVLIDSVSAIKAGGFLAASAPVARIEGRARILLSLEQRLDLRSFVEEKDRTSFDAERVYLPELGEGVVLAGRFASSGDFQRVYWISGENLWVDVQTVLSLKRTDYQTHGSALLWSLLEEAGRRAGLDVGKGVRS